MPRHLRILRLFWTNSLQAEMEYRLNFIVAAISSLGGIVGSIFALSLFFKYAAKINEWTIDQALLVLGLYTVFEGLSNALLAPNLSRIVQHVQQGTLDFVLLKPIDSQFWLSFRNFSPWGIPNIVFGLVLLVYAMVKTHSRPADLVFALIPVAAGLVILYSIWFIIGATSVWFVKVWNATEVLRSYIEAGRYPVQLYPGALQLFFRFVIPVAFLTTIPAQTMRGDAATGWVITAVALAAGLFLIARSFWRFALRYYTSASS